jgi:pyruvate,water dikinase
MSREESTIKNRERFLVGLGEDKSTEIASVGGKGASLGKLVKAGFPVPSGFVIPTVAYEEFLHTNGLRVKIEKILSGLDYENLDELEKKTGKIRNSFIGSKLPDSLTREIMQAYKELGEECVYVAVRSSATAEDLAGASFAGQYETFLDVIGEDSLLDAVIRCWASMWTARVTMYRHNKGFDHGEIGIAVVVQKMIDPDVAGVMFVGNPMNARADEIVINASWGLGEMVVSGSVTPDEYIVDRDTFSIKRRSLGSKELQVVRDKKNKSGTIQEPVPITFKDQYTLSDDQVSALAEMGWQVTTYYEGLPQDIEWALKDDAFFLLQSRPVTGVEFTWEEDLDLWLSLPEEEDAIWTRAAADEWWTGAVTPLFWSVRGRWLRDGAAGSYKPFNMGDLAEMRWLKYSRGTVYYNTRMDILMAEYSLPPSLREPMLRRLHPSQLEKAMNAPFDLWRTLKIYSSVEISRPKAGVFGFANNRERLRNMRKGGKNYDLRRKMVKTQFSGLEKLETMEDVKIKLTLENMLKGYGKMAGGGGWAWSFLYGPVIQALLEGVFRYWYNGNNPNAFTEVISGLPERTNQFNDDYDFWKLAETIRHSDKLCTLINEFEGAAFFEELKNHKDGRIFLSQYDEFLEMNFYRGHADRDIYYSRRIEDPMLDYKALRLLANAEEVEDPEEREKKLKLRRESATEEVIKNLAKQPIGDIKVLIFKFLVNYILLMLESRDEGRSAGDATTFWKKKMLGELGRRTVSRGLLKGEDDFYFLSLDELGGLLEGIEPQVLARAKIAARRKAFDRFITHEEDPPIFLKGNMPIDEDVGAGAKVGEILKGIGTSRGLASGRARLIPTLENIGSLEKGDILVCHGTDPGWTSAFSIVSGVIAQTGGMLAHFSCLSREYGLPAVSLPNAMKLIKDGTIIEMNGDNGEIRLVSK